MAFKDFWGTAYPEWCKEAMRQARFDLRWVYRWSGKRVPQLAFEEDRTQADAIEEYMSCEEENRLRNLPPR